MSDADLGGGEAGSGATDADSGGGDADYGGTGIDPGGSGTDAVAEGLTGTDAGGRGSDRGPAPVLELVDVTKTYETGGETVTALSGADLAVRPGESVAVIGPSGSGKSTMLNLLGLLDAPTEGARYLAGEDVTRLADGERTRARKEFVGFVFQDFFLVPTLTARENVALPTMFDAEVADERAARLLERVGLGDRLDHYPDELSGGQKQRVAIARALINEPRVVLADEPTGNLDRDTGERILSLFDEVRAEGVAVVLVTHDPQVTEYAGRTVRLTDGEVRASDGRGVYATGDSQDGAREHGDEDDGTVSGTSQDGTRENEDEDGDGDDGTVSGHGEDGAREHDDREDGTGTGDHGDAGSRGIDAETGAGGDGYHPAVDSPGRDER